MPLVNGGRDHFVAAILGTATTPFNNANARLGVGDGTAGFLVTHGDLQGASKARMAMDATYPTGAGTNVLTYRATFGTADANFAWNEWGVFNAATGGTMLNRKVEALGTKPNTQTWQFTVTITVNA